MERKILGSVIALSLAFVMLFGTALDNTIDAADVSQPTQKQKSVIGEAADFLEDMDMGDMADNVRTWLNDGKIKIDPDLRANGVTNRKGEITIKGKFVTPLPENELQKFKRVVNLAHLLLHEKVHAHQAPEGGSLAEGVETGDWLAGYDVMKECVGPDPLEVEAYYRQIRAKLVWAEKINAQATPEGLEPSEQTIAEIIKHEKFKWLHEEASNWAKVLKNHNFEKAAKFAGVKALADSFKEIDDNIELNEEQKVAQKRELLDSLISKLFDEDDFYDRARKLYNEKKGTEATSFIVPLSDELTEEISKQLPNGGGELTINGLPENVDTGMDSFLEITVHDFEVPPQADPGYEIISPVYEVSWNSRLPVPFELTMTTAVESSYEVHIAAFGLNRTEIERDWTLLETQTVIEEGMTYATAMADAATMYALVTPRQSFVDVPPNHWAYESAQRLMSKGVLDGGALLLPQMQVTREMFVKYLVKSLGLEITAADVPFTDVSTDSPYFPYVSTAYHNGLTAGVSEDEFGMGQIIPREQSITFLIRAVGMEDEALEMEEGEMKGYIDSFFDIYTDCSEWAHPYIAQAVKELFTNGYPDGTMRGRNLLSHAEVIALIDRIMIHVAYNGR